ncbi:hypothetical protein [Rhodospirillum sp. A1_3_36]|uniref:DUF7222 domain-containing protein n=1 Tax=Rhodospirillum sp. A1_3_36 TaxID=3391666 RepID=UPI0039A5FE76
MSTSTLSALSDRLTRLIEDDPNSIRAAVALEAWDYDDPEEFFRDFLSCGCVSGFIPSLAFYSSTHAFFDRHYDEIEELREDWEDCTGEPMRIKGDLKNFLAWYAFEETAYRMVQEFEDEGLVEGIA